MNGCSSGPAKFLVLNTAASWGQGDLSRSTVAIAESGISLPLSTEYAVDQVVDGSLFPPKANFAAMATGHCGLVYLLDADSRIVWIYDPGQSRFERVPAIDGLFTRPVSLALDENTLFVADGGDTRVFALALLNGQIRWTAGADVASADGAVRISGFLPIALAAGRNGHLYCLDGGNTTVAHFDPHGQLLERLDIPVAAGARLAALAQAPDGTLYVLDAGNGKILRRAPQGTFAELLAPGFDAASLAVDQAGILYAGQGSRTQPPVPEDRFLWRFQPDGTPLGHLPAYSGPADALAINARGTIYAFGRETRRLTILKSGTSFLIPPNTPPPEADYYSKAFDSGSPGTRWHKVMVEADLPANTQYWIYYRAADSPNAPESWPPPLVNPGDALLINATGRFLWLKIRLVGSESNTPVIHSIRVFFPRTSYLRYLPAIYSEDPASRDFLERFLSIFESIFTGIETQTTNLVRYFDPRQVSGDFLRWLARWLSVTVDETWTDAQLRTLLLEAPDLFRQRGTRGGIAEMIRIYMGDTPLIVERPQLACAQDLDIQNVYSTLYGSGPYCFCVLIRPFQAVGTAVKGITQGCPDPDHSPVSAAGAVELVFGSRAYQIPLTGRNSLHGLRDAINDLAVGVTAAVSDSGSGTGRYTLQLRALRIGPKALALRDRPGDDTSGLLTVTDPGAYTVFAPQAQEDRDALQRILDQEKPAHTCAGLQVLQPKILLDMHSYLEVNSWLMKPEPILDSGSAMPLDSVIDDDTETGQVGLRSRLELDTALG